MGFGGLFYFFTAILICAGALAISEIIKKKNAKAGEVLDKIAAYQGYAGLTLLVLGVINLLKSLKYLDLLLKFAPISTIIMIVAFVSAVLLGLLQSISLAKSWNILSEEKANALEGKLTSIKIPLGFAAIISGVFIILWVSIGWRF